MLAIRMQRTGRTGHASFRVIVQDSTQSPMSGKVVAQLGSYDPHTKAVALDKAKAAFFLEHGAHPSDRIAMLLKQEGVKLPSWVEKATKKSAKIRNPEKLRRNRPDSAEATEGKSADVEAMADKPAEPAAKVASEAPAEAAAEIVDTPVEAATAETAAEEVSTEVETPAEAPAEEAKVSEATAEEPVAVEPETPAEEAVTEVAAPEIVGPEAEKTPEKPAA